MKLLFVLLSLPFCCCLLVPNSPLNTLSKHNRSLKVAVHGPKLLVPPPFITTYLESEVLTAVVMKSLIFCRSVH
jgi:hypothetical protein